MKKVYLCGGINGLSDAEAKDWRAEASAALIRAGFVVLDPMRRDFRGVEGDHAQAIVKGDLFDIKASHILLVNASRPSWGTAMEVAHARHDVHRKAIVAFGAGEAPSPWLVTHCDRLGDRPRCRVAPIAVALTTPSTRSIGVARPAQRSRGARRRRRLSFEVA